MARPLTLGIALVAAMVIASAPTAAAGGGSWMRTAQESHEPGDEVEVVGYVGATLSEEDGPFLARLSVTTPADLAAANVNRSWLDLGPVTIEPTGLGGYLASRVSIRFTLPDAMEPGEYYVEVRDADGDYFGDLEGAWLYVGMEMGHTPWMEWPYDEPLIQELPDHAMIDPMGTPVSVADLKAGRFPAFAERYMLDPSILEQPGIVTTTTVMEPEPPRFIVAAEPVPPTTSASGPVSETGTPAPRRAAAPTPPSLVEEPTAPDWPGDVAIAAATIALVGAIAALGVFGWSRTRRRRAEVDDRHEERTPALR